MVRCSIVKKKSKGSSCVQCSTVGLCCIERRVAEVRPPLAGTAPARIGAVVEGRHYRSSTADKA